MRRPVLPLGKYGGVHRRDDPAMAQRTTGEILGKVWTKSGGVLPGVTVTLRGAAVPGLPRPSPPTPVFTDFPSCRRAPTTSSTPLQASAF